jgi:hypothetical protein
MLKEKSFMPLLRKFLVITGFLICSIAPTRADAALITTNGNGEGPTDVGTWYITYYSDGIWAAGFRSTPVMYRPLCSETSNDFRTYNSDDTAVMDFHLRQLAEAKIDFILFDNTNGGESGYYMANAPIWENSRIMCERIKLWNDSHSWKIKYAHAIGVYGIMRGSDPVGVCIEKQAEYVYTNYVTHPSYGGAYYELNGKPLLVTYTWDAVSHLEWEGYGGDKTYGSRFTVRSASSQSWIGPKAGLYGWNLCDAGVQVHEEVELVMPGFKAANGHFVGRQNGVFYANCWNTVLNNPLPKIVMITAFNDYCEDAAVWITETSLLVDGTSEKWYGTDGQLHASMYWDMTKAYIDTLRASPVDSPEIPKPTLPRINAAASSIVTDAWPATSAIDGTGSCWSSAAMGAESGTPQWIYVDMGAEYEVERVRLVPRTSGLYFPVDFIFQYSDDAQTWTDVPGQSYSNISNPGGTERSFDFSAAVTARYIRLYVTRFRADETYGYHVQIAEFYCDGPIAGTVARKSSAVSRKWELAIAPNPFNPNCRVTFSSATIGMATLAIYDVHGRLVKTLLHERFAVGSHSVAWDGTDRLGRKAPAGVYVYKLSAGNQVLTKKAILER